MIFKATGLDKITKLVHIGRQGVQELTSPEILWCLEVGVSKGAEKEKLGDCTRKIWHPGRQVKNCIQEEGAINGLNTRKLTITT